MIRLLKIERQAITQILAGGEMWTKFINHKKWEKNRSSHEQNAQHNMAEISPNTPIIAMNINELNSSIKWHSV